jgi:hypothetical protein
MKINRVNVKHGDGADLFLEFEAREGMSEVLRLCSAIEDGSAMKSPTSSSALSLQPDDCSERGHQECSDCPELRCGDQLWPMVREPKYAAIVSPTATDLERLDAAILLCWRLRCLCDEATSSAAEARDERDAALKSKVELEAVRDVLATALGTDKDYCDKLDAMTVARLVAETLSGVRETVVCLDARLIDLGRVQSETLDRLHEVERRALDAERRLAVALERQAEGSHTAGGSDVDESAS